MTSADLRSLADRADAALDTDDMVEHAQAFTELRTRAECFEEPVSSKEWARLLVSLSLVEHALGRSWRAPLSAALLADPTVNHTVGPADIRGFIAPQPDETHYIPVANDGVFFLDGRQITSAPPGDLDGPHIVQSYAEGRWETRYVEDEPYPSNWLAPLQTEQTLTRRSAAPLALGVGLAAIGSAAGTASWIASRGTEYPSAGTETALKATNIAGWTAAAVGAGLATVHLATGRASVNFGPGHIRLSARF